MAITEVVGAVTTVRDLHHNPGGKQTSATLVQRILQLPMHKNPNWYNLMFYIYFPVHNTIVVNLQ